MAPEVGGSSLPVGHLCIGEMCSSFGCRYPRDVTSILEHTCMPQSRSSSRYSDASVAGVRGSLAAATTVPSSIRAAREDTDTSRHSVQSDRTYAAGQPDSDRRLLTGGGLDKSMHYSFFAHSSTACAPLILTRSPAFPVIIAV